MYAIELNHNCIVAVLSQRNSCAPVLQQSWRLQNVGATPGDGVGVILAVLYLYYSCTVTVL